MHKAVATPSEATAAAGLIPRMHAAQSAIDQTAPSHGKQDAAGGDEIPVEYLKQREQRGTQNHAHNPARTDACSKATAVMNGRPVIVRHGATKPTAAITMT